MNHKAEVQYFDSKYSLWPGANRNVPVNACIMENEELIFKLANGMAGFGWLLLLLFYKRPGITNLLVWIIVAALCVLYSTLIFKTLQPGDWKSFTTLEGVVSLMSVPGAALVGWIHYLAFDLMTGVFVAVNGQRHGVRFILLLPCLLCTFMLGPFGLALYFLVRWYTTGHYFASNYQAA